MGANLGIPDQRKPQGMVYRGHSMSHSLLSASKKEGTFEHSRLPPSWVDTFWIQAVATVTNKDQKEGPGAWKIKLGVFV